MKIHWKLALVAGLVGTVAFDLLGLLLTGQWWDIPQLLSGKLGTGLYAGVFAHYANGALLAVIYSAVAPSLWGPRWARALTFVTAETVFGVWLFMLPLVGAGIAGLEASAAMPAISLARHLAFGLGLALLIPVAAPDLTKSRDGYEVAASR